ncbi:hypothetical protein MRX96_034302 [Rhipicephalus microplus]
MHMVMFAARPNDLQLRVQREIDTVIGHQRLPTWEDRKLMPFTMACVWELERWKRTEPFGLPRGTEKDVIVDNIMIPGGSVVLFNLWADGSIDERKACLSRRLLLWKTIMSGRAVRFDANIFDGSQHASEV